MKTGLRQRLIVVVLAGVLTWILAWPVLNAPNQYLMSWTGDGMKNYYTLAYYLKHDKALQFTGMNYPFGEHIVFTDNQPALALLLNFIDDHLFPIHHLSVGIVNSLMYASLMLCALFLFLILKRLGLPFWYSLPATMLITFLSPQIARMSAHFSLSYVFFFPALWWMVMKGTESKGRWFYPGMVFFIWCFSGLSIYITS